MTNVAIPPGETGRPRFDDPAWEVEYHLFVRSIHVLGMMSSRYVDRYIKDTGRAPTFQELFEHLLPGSQGDPAPFTMGQSAKQQSRLRWAWRHNVTHVMRQKGWITWAGEERSLHPGPRRSATSDIHGTAVPENITADRGRALSVSSIATESARIGQPIREHDEIISAAAKENMSPATPHGLSGDAQTAPQTVGAHEAPREAHYSAPDEPDAAPTAKTTDRMSTYISATIRARAVAAFRATNYLEDDDSWSKFVERAILAETHRREAAYNDGEPFEAPSDRLRPGRPLRQAG